MAMADEVKQKTGPGGAKKPAPQLRGARLAAALRDNLRRRKAQARGRRHAAEGDTRPKD
jgi:hypothetical protein